MSGFDEDTPLVHQIEEASEERTLADQLRDQRQEIAETKDTLLPLTGYEKFGVQVRHRLVSRAELEQIGRKIVAETRDRGERNMRIILDTIINSTTGFFVQMDGAPNPDPITDPKTGGPLLTWDQFANYLGWNTNGDAGDARSALYWIFGANEFMVGQYGISLNRWMGNTSIKVDEEFLGEAF